MKTCPNDTKCVVWASSNYIKLTNVVIKYIYCIYIDLSWLELTLTLVDSKVGLNDMQPVVCGSVRLFMLWENIWTSCGSGSSPNG